MLLTQRPKPTQAKLRLWASGGTISGFAQFHNCSVGWAKRVLDGREPVPDRFRQDFATFLGLSEREVDGLFAAEDLDS